MAKSFIEIFTGFGFTPARGDNYGSIKTIPWQHINYFHTFSASIITNTAIRIISTNTTQKTYINILFEGYGDKLAGATLDVFQDTFTTAAQLIRLRSFAVNVSSVYPIVLNTNSAILVAAQGRACSVFISGYRE